MLKQLPIGSIVRVAGSSEQLMIVAQFPITTVKDQQGYFDFGAVSLPIGLSNQQLYFFNKENIQELIFMGYTDIKFQTFISNCEEYERSITFPKLSVSDFEEDKNEK